MKLEQHKSKFECVVWSEREMRIYGQKPEADTFVAGQSVKGPLYLNSSEREVCWRVLVQASLVIGPCI